MGPGRAETLILEVNKEAVDRLDEALNRNL